MVGRVQVTDKGSTKKPLNPSRNSGEISGCCVSTSPFPGGPNRVIPSVFCSPIPTCTQIATLYRQESCGSCRGRVPSRRYGTWWTGMSILKCTNTKLAVSSSSSRPLEALIPWTRILNHLGTLKRDTFPSLQSLRPETDSSNAPELSSSLAPHTF